MSERRVGNASLAWMVLEMYGATLCLPGKFLASRKKAEIPHHGLSLFHYRIIWIWCRGNTNNNRCLPTCPERSRNINNSLSLGTLLEHIPILPLLKVFSKFLGITSTSFMTLKTTSDHSILMKSSSLSSLPTNPMPFFQSLPISHVLCLCSCCTCCIPLGSCHCATIFSELVCPGRMSYSNCSLLPVLRGDNLLPHLACWSYSSLFQYRVWHFFFFPQEHDAVETNPGHFQSFCFLS